MIIIFWCNCVKCWYVQGFLNFLEIFIFSFFVSQELYLIWLWFSVHMSKLLISSAVFFSFFQNSDLLDLSKFISNCQKEILRCAPPSSHVSDFSYILVSLRKGVHMECNEIFQSNVNFFLQTGTSWGEWGTAMGELILNLTLMQRKSVIQIESSFY